MVSIEVAGSHLSALTHMAMIGLAVITQDRLGVTPRLVWTPALRATVMLPGIDSARVGSAVVDHATECMAEHSWVREVLSHEGRVTAVFSPRIKVASSDAAWASLQAARHRGIDRAQEMSDFLSLRFIQALGEPAYWRFANDGGRRPDDGASRWEMKTRNKGDEFIGQRFRDLGAAVAGRTPQAVVDGLTGHILTDEAGKNKADSRSATGLTRPRPTDNALAWCALWGIASFPLIPQLRGRSATPGYVVGKRGRKALMALPMPVVPMTPARIRSIVRRTELTAVAAGGQDVDAAATMLREFGVGAVMSFPFERVGSISAPELRLLDGVMTRIGHQP